MSTFHVSLLVWFGLFATIGVCLELLAWADAVPWNTLTWTIRQTFAHYGQGAYLGFFGLLAVFMAHIVYKRAKKDEPEN